MSQDFHPQNALERKLVEAQEGRAPVQELIAVLMEAEVFMPVYEKQSIGGLQTSDKAKPLTLKDEDTGEEVLVLFTAPERGKVFLRDYPGYGGGLVAEFKWILEKLGVGYGIALNPGLEVGLELEAESVRQISGASH